MFASILTAVGFARRERYLGLLGGCLLLAALLESWLGYDQVVTWGPLRVTSFGALLALAMLIACLVVLGFQRVHELPRRQLEWACAAAIMAGLVGARLQYVLENYRNLSSPREALAITEGGLAGYGGMLLGGAAGLLVLRQDARSRAIWADAAAIGCSLGVALTRIGCYLFGSDFGLPLSTAAPAWLRRLGAFPRWEGELSGLGSPAWLAHVESRGLPASAPFSLPTHPTQLYEAAGALALMLLLIWLRTKQERHGELLVWWVLGYGCVRLVVDGFRDDPERWTLGPSLDPAVFLGAGLLLLGLSAVAGPLNHLVRPRLASGPRRAWFLPASACLTLALALSLSRVHPQTQSLKPSLSQWLALTTGLSCALFWRTWSRWTGFARAVSADPPESSEGAPREPSAYDG